MNDPTCEGFMRTYAETKNDSKAIKGICPDTAGYLANGEIDLILEAVDQNLVWYHDDKWDSDIVQYGTYYGSCSLSPPMLSCNRPRWGWVGYMTKKTKDSRRQRYCSMNFAEQLTGRLTFSHSTTTRNCKYLYTLQVLNRLLNKAVTKYNTSWRMTTAINSISTQMPSSVAPSTL